MTSTACIRIFTATRPVAGASGNYRVNLRHGVSRIRSGMRHTLGIIFHDGGKCQARLTRQRPSKTPAPIIAKTRPEIAT